ALQPLRMGIEIAAVLAKSYPGNFDVAKMIALVGNQATIEQLSSGTSPAAIVASWNHDLASFRRIRARFLLYP
ncbi:MAG: hypothetical protein ACRD4Y_15295, partial [Candidatus Acidiferrales bacterium]